MLLAFAFKESFSFRKLMWRMVKRQEEKYYFFHDIKVW